VVENLNPEMRHPHLVDIWEGETEFQFDPGRIFSDRMDLSAKIPDRF
jgi:hypothetical protein